MPISQTTITGSIKTPDNADAVITSVTFTLEGSDHEAGELIAANTVYATVTTPTGDFSVTLWPNDRGIKGTTRYTVAFTFTDRSKVTGLNTIYVRHSDTPITIEDVAFDTEAALIKSPRIVVTTAALFPGLEKTVNTLYLIRG